MEIRKATKYTFFNTKGKTIKDALDWLNSLDKEYSQVEPRFTSNYSDEWKFFTFVDQVQEAGYLFEEGYIIYNYDDHEVETATEEEFHLYYIEK